MGSTNSMVLSAWRLTIMWSLGFGRRIESAYFHPMLSSLYDATYKLKREPAHYNVSLEASLDVDNEYKPRDFLDEPLEDRLR